MQKPPLSIQNESFDREALLLIAEFNALRAEMLDNFQTARTIATLYLAAIGAIFFAVISGQVKPSVIILIPGISAIFWWIHLDTRMIVALIGGYLDILSDRAKDLGSKRIFTWEQEIRLKDQPFYKVPLSFWPWKMGIALDGTAHLIYLPPSIISLWMTYGKITGFIVYEDAAKKVPFFTLHEDTWIISLIVLIIVLIRSIATNNIWWKAPDVLRRK